MPRAQKRFDAVKAFARRTAAVSPQSCYGATVSLYLTALLATGVAPALGQAVAGRTAGTDDQPPIAARDSRARDPYWIVGAKTARAGRDLLSWLVIPSPLPLSGTPSVDSLTIRVGTPSDAVVRFAARGGHCGDDATDVSWGGKVRGDTIFAVCARSSARAALGFVAMRALSGENRAAFLQGVAEGYRLGGR